MYINYKEVGKRIAKRRKNLGLKQSDVVETANLSDNYLSHIDTARTTPSIDVLMKICAALDTTPDSLLLGTIDEADSLDDNIIQKLKLLDHQKKALLASFIDCLIDTEI